MQLGNQIDYGGVDIRTISGAQQTGDGKLLIPDLRIFGFAGQIGNLDMRGALRVYETFDNNKEVIELKITGFSYGYSIHQLDKICKILMV